MKYFKRTLIIMGDLALMVMLFSAPAQAQDVDGFTPIDSELQQLRQDHREQVRERRRDFQENNPEQAERIHNARVARAERIQRARRQYAAEHPNRPVVRPRPQTRPLTRPLTRPERPRPARQG